MTKYIRRQNVIQYSKRLQKKNDLNLIGHFSLYGGNMLDRSSNETGFKETFEKKHFNDLKLPNDKFNYIMIYIQERLLSHLINSNIKVNYVFIDETHKLFYKDTRTMYFYKILEFLCHTLVTLTTKKHFLTKINISKQKQKSPINLV